MPLPLLSGEVVDSEAERQPLLDEIERLKADLRTMRQERDRALADGLAAKSSVEGLRDVLGPLRRAINAIYGEIAASGVNPEPSAIASPSLGQVTNGTDPRLHSLDKWDGIKKRLGGTEAELIDVLLTAGPRTNTQLKSLLKLAYSTVCALTLKMSNMGFITKSGDAYKLRD